MAKMGSQRSEAERLEREGRVEDAARAFVAAGSLADAVRVFADAKRYRDAAALIMNAIRVKPSEVGGLRGEKRRMAHRAALYFAADGHYDEALAIVEALGDADAVSKIRRLASGDGEGPTSVPSALLDEAGSLPPSRSSRPRGSEPGRRHSTKPASRRGKSVLDPAQAHALARTLEARGETDLARTAYARLGAHADLARVSERAGAFEEAARAWARAGRHDEAARCKLAAGDEAAALDEMLRVPVDDPAYREVAAWAVGLARRLSRLDAELDRFVRQLLVTGVRRSDELPAFYDLARLYESHGHTALACEVLERIETHQRRYRDVAQRLVVLRARARLVNGDAATGAKPADGVGERWESHQRLPEIHSSWPKGLESGLAPRSDVPTAERDTSIPPSDEVRTGRSSSPWSALHGAGLPVGTAIGGRYRVKRRIGEGGTSEIYEVLDVELDTTVALKLFSSTADNRHLLARCRRELMLARELTHANIVRVYDIGVHEERRFITMEMLDGSDLRDVMDGCLPTWSQSLRYLIQACNGLHAAHLRGVVHRDVKPENLFLTVNEQVKVTDFGIALRATDTDTFGVEGQTAGTPVYMSPEQIRDYSNVGPSADIYSLGVVAYELLTGEVPFDSDDGRALMLMHLAHEPPPPTWLEPDLPSELEVLVLQALAKNPDHRVKSCREMAERLQAICDGMS